MLAHLFYRLQGYLQRFRSTQDFYRELMATAGYKKCTHIPWSQQKLYEQIISITDQDIDEVKAIYTKYGRRYPQ